MDADTALIPRAELLKQFRISDASERRRRSGGANWPPHLLMGRNSITASPRSKRGSVVEKLRVRARRKPCRLRPCRGVQVAVSTDSMPMYDSLADEIKYS